MLPRFLHPLAIRYLRSGNHPAKLRLLHHARGCFRGLICPVSPGLRLVLDYGDWLQQNLLCGRGHEPLTLGVLEGLLQPGGIFVDVGANIGLFSLLAAQRVGDTGRVVALEPNPRALRRLRENLALNPHLRVDVVPAAASDHAGEVRLMQPDDWNLGGVCISDQGTVAVRCAPVDELLGPCHLPAAPTLMKIDVEGHEPSVLRGLLASTLRPRNIIFEYKPTFFPLANAEAELWRPLRDAGYVLRCVDGSPLHHPAPEDNVWAHLPETAAVSTR